MHGLDPPTVDHDVPAALGIVLDGMVARFLDEARTVDDDFAADIAGRVVSFTLSGGRRRRSQLLWWSLRACGGGRRETEPALLAAAAVELIQTCALIHDDVMDGSPLRRGEPAVHASIDAQYETAGRPRPCATFGRSAAILAGDLALAWADDVFMEALLKSPYATKLGRQWRALRSEMVAGQYLDLRSQVTDARSAARAVRTAVLKTARYSVVHPLVLGARLAGAGEGVVQALGQVGLGAGLAFQLHDDLQGVFGDPATTGKPAGEDLRDGKATYLLAVGRLLCARQGDAEGLRMLETVVGSAGATDRQLREVTELLAGHGARDHVEARIRRLCARAVGTLRATALDQDPTERLARILLDAAGVEPTASAARTTHSGPPPRRAAATMEGAR
ncbi:polyprenyl synthetase family protein [Streptomyces sp. NPDC056362]|uniref:polyprenyl synthetase family protein n=1 Tax=unclassified Streptomyces TaxID=2593676 RepID=UPI0035DE8681